MTRYQACRSLGIDPIVSALIAFTHAVYGAPQGRIAILHMTIFYDPSEPYRRGMKARLEAMQ